MLLRTYDKCTDRVRRSKSEGKLVVDFGALVVHTIVALVIQTSLCMLHEEVVPKSTAVNAEDTLH